MEYTFIVNPKSKSGRGGLIWNQIEPELKKRRIQYRVRFTEYEKEATEITAELTSDEAEHTIVVLGGDGTMDEVINGIRDCSKVTLGYIPTGSGNDFTRALKLPTDSQEALHNILYSEKTISMDVGEMCSEGVSHRFAVSTGIGFDAAVCHQVAVSKLKVLLNKVKLGQLSYLAVALRRLFRDAHTKAVVQMDEDKERNFENTYFVAVMNHPYEGGGFFFCPDAKVDDGYLDIIIVSGLPRWKVLLLLPLAFKGKHVGIKGIDIFRCKKVDIRMESEFPIHTDGEPIAIGKELKAKLLDKQVRIIVPEDEM